LATEQGLGIAEMIGEKRQQVLLLARQHGVTRIRVFGSVARGEAHADSDIDLVVQIAPEKSIFDLVALWQDLSDLLGREVDLVTERSLQASNKRAALADAVEL